MLVLSLGLRNVPDVAIATIRWILNADAAPVGAAEYAWKDADTWTDANVWKD